MEDFESICSIQRTERNNRLPGLAVERSWGGRKIREHLLRSAISLLLISFLEQRRLPYIVVALLTPRINRELLTACTPGTTIPDLYVTVGDAAVSPWLPLTVPAKHIP